MNKFATIFCLLLAISLVNTASGMTAKLFDSVFPMKQYGTTATTSCVSTVPTANQDFVGTDDYAITTANTTASFGGDSGIGYDARGLVMGDMTAAGNDGIFTSVTVGIIKQACLTNMMIYSGQAATVNAAQSGTGTTPLNGSSAETAAADVGFIITPGGMGATATLTAMYVGMAGDTGTVLASGRMAITSATATIWAIETASTKNNLGKSNVTGYGDASKLGGVATPQAASSLFTPHTQITTAIRSKRCLEQVTNLGGLMWCQAFTTATDGTTKIPTTAVVNFANTANATNDLPAAASSLHKLLATAVGAAGGTTNPYVVEAAYSGLLSSFEASADQVMATTQEIRSTTGIVGVKDAWVAYWGSSLTAVKSDVEDDMLNFIIFFQKYVIGTSTWGGAQDYGLAPTDKLLGNRAYCDAFGSKNTTPAGGVNASLWASPSTYWWKKTTELTYDCRLSKTYEGMNSTYVATPTESLVVSPAALTSSTGYAEWVGKDGVCNGVIPTGSTTRPELSDANSGYVKNCCKNSVAIGDFVHCMNFVSTVDLTSTTTSYAALLHVTASAADTAANCINALAKGLNWMTPKQIESWHATCNDSVARKSLLEDLKTDNDNVSKTTTLSLSEWQTKYTKYYNSWTYASGDSGNSWSGVRASQLGGSGCAAAFEKPSYCNEADASGPANEANWMNTTKYASWSMLTDTAQNAVTKDCAAQVTAASTAQTTKMGYAANCCMNATTIEGYDSCVRSSVGDSLATYSTTAWENSTTATGIQNILGLFSGATAVVNSWDGATNALNTTNQNYLAQVWGWRARNEYWSLYNLFNSGTNWYDEADTNLFNHEDDKMTFTYYNDMLSKQPMGFDSDFLGFANCKTQVAALVCTAFNQYNSLFQNALYHPQAANSTLCPLAADDADHAGLMDLCCERLDTASASQCVQWAAKANVVNMIGPFATAFTTAQATFATTAATGMATGLEGSSLEMYNCQQQFLHLPINSADSQSLCSKYGDDADLWAAANKADDATACAMEATSIASVTGYVDCLKGYKSNASSGSDASGSDASGSDASGSAASGTAASGTAASGSGTADCSCYANLLKTFGTSLVMALLLNFLN